MICTAWIPLLDTCKNNGGMGMAKKTQKRGYLGQLFLAEEDIFSN